MLQTIRLTLPPHRATLLHMEKPETKSVRLDTATYEELKAHTEKMGMKLTFALKEAVNLWLDRRRKVKASGVQ